MSRFRRSPVRRSVFLAAAALLVLAALTFAQTKALKPKVLQSTNPELRLKGFEEYKAMRDASKFKDLKWQFIGPTNVSGRVTDVAVVAPRAGTTRSTWPRPRAASGRPRTRVRPGRPSSRTTRPGSGSRASRSTRP